MNDSPLSFPISSASLQAKLPHRPPMVWIDSVESADGTHSLCQVRLHKDGLQCSIDGLRQSTLIEWMAQAAGFSQSAISQQVSKNAYLAAVTSLEYCSEETWNTFQKKLLSIESVLISIRVQLLRTLGPITLFSGEVFDGEISLGKGSFKTFSE